MSDDLVTAYRLLMADVYELAGRSRSTSESLAQQRGQTAARWHVLSVLLDGTRTVPAIANRLGLSRQAVQRVVNDLIATGLVKRSVNVDHKRSYLVEATPDGKKLARGLYRESARVRAKQIDRAGIGPEDLDHARQTIRRLLSALADADD